MSTKTVYTRHATSLRKPPLNQGFPETDMARGASGKGAWQECRTILFLPEKILQRNSGDAQPICPCL